MRCGNKVTKKNGQEIVGSGGAKPLSNARQLFLPYRKLYLSLGSRRDKYHSNSRRYLEVTAITKWILVVMGLAKRVVKKHLLLWGNASHPFNRSNYCIHRKVSIIMN